MTGLVTSCIKDKCSNMCLGCSKQYLSDLPETHLSLTPSPFHHSVFDCLQYADTLLTQIYTPFDYKGPPSFWLKYAAEVYLSVI